MKVGFIGAGKVGCSFGRYLALHGIVVSGYYSRTYESAIRAVEGWDHLTSTAKEVGGQRGMATPDFDRRDRSPSPDLDERSGLLYSGIKAYRGMEELVADSDIIFVTTPDDAIAAVFADLAQMEAGSKILCHCSGALSSEVLPGQCCSLHPLLAVADRESEAAFASCVFTLEGEGFPEGASALRRMMESCGNVVVEISAKDKARYHAAAVCASNLVIGLYEEAVSLLRQCGFEEEDAEKALLPLFIGNANSMAKNGAEAALTGPVERGDAATVEKHLGVLEGEDRELYRLLSKRVLSVAERKHGERDYGILSALL